MKLTHSVKKEQGRRDDLSFPPGSASVTSAASGNTANWQSFFRPSLRSTGGHGQPLPVVEPHRTNHLQWNSKKLYGRDDDIAALQGLLGQSTAQNLVLLGGPSGMGKTSLACTLRQPIQAAGGAWGMGKYDFGGSAEPHAAVMEAGRQVCQQFQPSIEQQGQLRHALGTAIHGLAAVMPQILPLTGLSDDEHAYAVAIGDVQNRFQFALVQFWKTIVEWTSGNAVMIVDDMQWADPESLQMLKRLVQDVPGLLIVGCYRSNEVDSTHIFAQWVRDLESDYHHKDVVVTKIQVKPMSQEALALMLKDVLSNNDHKSDEDRMQELVAVTYEKTGGNPFFTLEFLKTLQDTEALAYNEGTESWIWDMDDIRNNAAATSNVVEMMVHSLFQLPVHLTRVLPLAACLGTTFRNQTLQVVAQVFSDHTNLLKTPTDNPDLRSPSLWNCNKWLASCVKEGILKAVPGGQQHKWTHDKFREASLSLIVPEKVQDLRFRVGKIMLSKLTDEELSQSAFVVADLLNAQAEKKVRNSEELLQIAEINLRAGKSAMALASFKQAVDYLQAAFVRMPPNTWHKNYEFALELHSCTAEAYYCIGDSEKLESHCKVIIEKEDIPLTDKFRAYNVLIDSIGNRNMLDRAIKLCLLLLEELGCELPKKNFLFHTLAGVGRIKMTSTKFDIHAMKEITDVSKVQAMRVLDKLATFTYINGSPLLPLAIFKNFRWSIKYGLSQYSPPAFATVGLILCAQLNDLQGGRTYGEFALAMLEEMDFDVSAPRTIFLVYAFVMNYCQPWHESLPPFIEAYHLGLAQGDVETAMWAIVNNIGFSFHCGKSVRAIENDCNIYMKQMKDLRMDQPLAAIAPLLCGMQNLIGQYRQDASSILPDAEAKVSAYRKIGSGLEGMQREVQIWLAIFFSEDKQGADIALEIAKNGVKTSESGVGFHMMTFHSALACYTAHRNTKNRKNSGYLKLAKKHHQTIKTWAKAGNPNIVFSEQTLNAEAALVDGKNKKEALEKYAAACASAAQMGFRSYQALIMERWGNAEQEIGKLDKAVECWQKAVSIYKEWGAFAVAEKLSIKLQAMIAKDGNAIVVAEQALSVVSP